MLACKKCASGQFVKNGIVAGKQRYKCKNCNATFRNGDNRTNEKIIGNRDTATFRRLYDTVKHLTDCTFYSDDWDVFAKVLPAERHVIGKAHTSCIERDNSSTRHHLSRFTRMTQVISECEKMVDASLRIWHAVTNTELFKTLQEKLMSIFR